LGIATLASANSTTADSFPAFFRDGYLEHKIADTFWRVDCPFEEPCGEYALSDVEMQIAKLAKETQ
jgi:hypothetical protein